MMTEHSKRRQNNPQSNGEMISQHDKMRTCEVVCIDVSLVEGSWSIGFVREEHSFETVAVGVTVDAHTAHQTTC